MNYARPFRLGLLSLALIAGPASAALLYDNDLPNDSIGMATRPDSAGKQEIEAADDFVLTQSTRLTSATFTGLIPLGTDVSNIGTVRVEIYRVFPLDSNNPPSGAVPTRVNSPSDVAFLERESGSDLSYTTQLGLRNQGLNSVVNNISVNAGGEGKVLGQQVQFTTDFTAPIDLAAGHYFFVPQVELANGDFLWLSAARPPALTPFAPDLQAWMRNEALNPDWLRVGTDIVGGTTPPTFNGAFSLIGTPVPEPSSTLLFTSGLFVLGLWSLRKRS